MVIAWVGISGDISQHGQPGANYRGSDTGLPPSLMSIESCAIGMIGSAVFGFIVGWAVCLMYVMGNASHESTHEEWDEDRSVRQQEDDWYR